MPVIRYYQVMIVSKVEQEQKRGKEKVRETEKREKPFEQIES